MNNSINSDKIRDAVRGNLLKYTRKAFDIIPKLEKPLILDIGCGSGVPTIELAKLCDCRIMALDNDQYQLSLLEEKVKEDGLENRIEIINCSIHNMNFYDGSFDIVWSEGSIFVVGFEKGLREWKRFLKPGRFMAIHDERGIVDKKLKCILDCNYELLDYFILDKDVWWNEYYSPLEKEIRRIQKMYSDEADIMATFYKERREVETFKKNPEKCESVFFVLQRNKQKI